MKIKTVLTVMVLFILLAILIEALTNGEGIAVWLSEKISTAISNKVDSIFDSAFSGYGYY